MAERKANGKDILLLIDPAGGTAYKLVVCLTTNSFKRSTAILDASSKCGPDSEPGAQTLSIDLGGQVVVDPATGRIAESDIDTLWLPSTTVGWQMGPVTPVEGDVIYSGVGFFSDLETTFDMNGATFTATLAVQGNYTKTVQTGSGS